MWPDETYTILDSNKTNVTLNYGSKGPGSGVETHFEYWTRKKTNTDTNSSFYELHAKCYFLNIDVTNWKTDGSNKLSCQIGFQVSESRDWASLEMPYKTGTASDIASWKCIDGH